MSQEISCGFEFITTPDLQECLTEALRCDYSFIITPLIHPRFTRQHFSSSDKAVSFTRSDMLLTPQDWNIKVVGRISQLWNADVESPVVRQRHEDRLNQELWYCKGLGLPAIMLPLHGTESKNLARIVLSFYEASRHSGFIWTRVPLACRRTLRNVRLGEPKPEGLVDNLWSETWCWWSKFHEHLEWDKRVGVVVELTVDLPSQNIIDRWLGEPVKAVVIPTRLFYNNKEGYPILSKAHQKFVVSMVEHEAQVIISGRRTHDIKYYLQFMHRVWIRRPNVPDPLLQYGRGWEDYLQIPFQPLADDLDTHAYNDFETDPIKYHLYQNAIAKALTDFKTKATNEIEKQIEVQNLINEPEIEQGNNKDLEKDQSKTKSTEGQDNPHVSKMQENKNDNYNEEPNKIPTKEQSKTHTGDEKESSSTTANDELSVMPTLDKEQSKNNSPNLEQTITPVTVMVLGAGRGPLVRATLNAADITNTKVKVLAVEKNPCAVVVLASQVREIWRGRDVTVVPGDMRKLNLSTKADIIVSELLGPWGDNDLSPECLDGAAGLLKPSGISIPSQYTSYVAPIASACLWASARSAISNSNKEKNLETIWVVYMQNKQSIGDTKPVFTFEHPAKGILDFQGQEITDWRGLPLTDNRRCSTLTWEVAQDNVLHGFGGYFDCSLYGGEMFSTVPSTHSVGMISWFPVFIPIKTPIRVRRGENIKATFWRCVDSRKVWYEWLVEVGDRVTGIHNTSGRSSEIIL